MRPVHRLPSRPRVQRCLSLFFVTTLVVFSLTTSPARGQFDEPEKKSSGGSQLDEAKTVRVQIGIIVESTGGAMRGVYGTAPIPIDWPEQKVKIVDEENTSHVKKVKYRTVGKTMKQMEVTIPQVERGGTAKALVTFEVQRSAMKEPESTDGYVVPEKVDRALRLYLQASPFIETRNGKIRKLAKQLKEEAGDKNAWQTVEYFYDWVRDNIEYKKGPIKGAQKALKDKTGDCEELSSLFIALCRLNGIPARIVWIPSHCYPEFYLEDDEGNGYWFPCQAAGTRAFGSMPEHRIILQKGDNFKVPHEKKRQRYVSEFLRVDAPGNSPPKVKFVRKVLSD